MNQSPSTSEPYCPECGRVAEQGSDTHHFCFNHDDDGCVDFEWNPDTGYYLDPTTREPVTNPLDSVFS